MCSPYPIVDVGGPYRECFSNMCADLMCVPHFFLPLYLYPLCDSRSHATPLFVECPNQKNNVGLNREKWVINPSANSSLHLAMYEFLGVLMVLLLFVVLFFVTILIIIIRESQFARVRL